MQCHRRNGDVGLGLCPSVDDNLEIGQDDSRSEVLFEGGRERERDSE